jgi:signal transduction histidine kinase
VRGIRPGSGPFYDQVVKWLAARAAALPPRLQDLILALALAAVNVGSTLPYLSQLHPKAGVPGLVSAHPVMVALGLLVLQALPLIWRRSWPIGVFSIVGVARSWFDLLGYGFAPLPLGPAIAYYTVMARCSTGMRWALSAVLLAGIVESQSLPGHNEPYDFFIAALIFVVAGIAGLFSRARTALLSEVEGRAQRAEAARDQDAALAAARERARIARELHDVVAHHVSLMAVQAEAASSLLPGQPVAAGRSVEIIGETARQALVELRRLLGVLRGPGEQPQAAPSPTLSDLDVLLTQVRGAGLQVDLATEGSPGALAPGVGLTAYRIVQEALTNALRHSAAQCAAVRVCYDPEFVTIAVTDQGAAVTARTPAVASQGNGLAGQGAASTDPGSAVTATPAAAGAWPATDRSDGVSAGFGLAGIAERVASCGGTLTVGPTGGGGFAVTARLPRL